MEEDFQDTEIESTAVNGFMKKGSDNVFTIEVVWSNGWEIEISRRYSDFVAFHRALLKFNRGSICLPTLPSFKEIFESVFDDEEALVQPNLHLLDEYCSLMSEADGLLVQSFFESCQYDTKLRRRHIMDTANTSDINMDRVKSSKCLVLADYTNGSFHVKAGDIVTPIGHDRQDWALVGLRNGGRMQFGWLPTVCLLDIEGEDDPLVKDLITFFNDVDAIEDERLFCQDTSSRPSSTPFSTSSGGRQSTDLIKEGVAYYQYTLTEDCYLSSPFGEDVLLTNGEKMIVVDKDTDGWWYVCTLRGIEGWLPSTTLEPRRASLRKEKREMDVVYYPSKTPKNVPCYVGKTHEARHRDELSVKAGDLVYLLHESLSGWWTVRCENKVGLVPGVFLVKRTERSTSYQSLRKAYSIGFNSSLLPEAPPRREAFSVCSSPISPPPINDDVFQFGQHDRHPLTHHSRVVRSGTGSQSDGGTVSPQPILLFEEESSLGGGVKEDDRQQQIKHLSVTASPRDSPYSYLQNSSQSFVSKSPIPERFIQSPLGGTISDYRASPSMDHDRLRSRSPIPERFFTNSPVSPLRISPLSKSTHPSILSYQARAKSSPPSHRPNSSLASCTRKSRMRDGEEQSSVPPRPQSQPTLLITDSDDQSVSLHSSCSVKDVTLMKESMLTESMNDIRSSNKDSFQDSKIDYPVLPERSKSAPPLIVKSSKRSVFTKRTKKIDLRVTLKKTENETYL